MDKSDISGSWLYRINPQINIAGRLYDYMNWFDPERVIYDHELLFFGPDGEYEFIIAGKSCYCSANSYIIIPPGIPHTGKGINSKSVLRTWVHFDWEYIPLPQKPPILTYSPAEPFTEYVRKRPDYVPEGVLQGKLSDPDMFFEMQERIADSFNSGSRRRRRMARGLFLEMLTALFTSDTRHSVQKGKDERIVRRVRNALAIFAQFSFRESPPLRRYLKRLGQSYNHLARLFKKSYGITPLQYVNSLRMGRAGDLLRDTELNVLEVAERLGFDDVAYFCRLFKKVTGKRPSEAR